MPVEQIHVHLFPDTPDVMTQWHVHMSLVPVLEQLAKLIRKNLGMRSVFLKNDGFIRINETLESTDAAQHHVTACKDDGRAMGRPMLPIKAERKKVSHLNG